MGTRTSHPPGAFSWVELGTTDAAGARAFYTALFGWTYDERPLPGSESGYLVAQIGGDDVAGLYQRGQGDGPPAWLSYVTVASADDTAERARRFGAAIKAEPFDVLDAGRTAVLVDPQGAMVALWQPGRHIGAGRVNEPGCLAWNELATIDPDDARTFYGDLFGWEFRADAADPFRYWTIVKDGRLNGRLMPFGPVREDIPPQWRVYFAVGDLDTTVAEAEAHRGRVLVEPTSMPVGRYAKLADPQGATLYLLAGELGD
jgi:predicted enzyme related to lactoylglutathione lyase